MKHIVNVQKKKANTLTGRDYAASDSDPLREWETAAAQCIFQWEYKASVHITVTL